MKIQEIKEKIAELQNQLRVIQSECSHPAFCVTKQHKSNTGNYDPIADSYWTEFHCELCDKYWDEEGSK